MAPLPAAKAAQPLPRTEPLPQPPEITPSAPGVEDAESIVPNPPTLAPPPQRPPRRPVQHPAAPAGPQPATPAPTAPPAPAAPQLAIVLTPEQQRQYNSDIDQSLQRAEANLRALSNRQLSAEQQASLEEVRNFVRQAQAARTTDLPAAKRLAERADVLAANIANSMR